MSEHICRNCRWWTAPFTGFLPENPYGECRKTIEADSLAVSQFENCPLQCTPDFGCVQWEGKE